jgi:protein TonB
LSSIAPRARGKRYLAVGPMLTSALGALPASLAGSHWRRATAFLAALLLFGLLGTKFLAAGSRGQRSSDDRMPALRAHALLASRVEQRAIVRAAPPPAQRAIHTARVATVTHPHPRAARPIVRLRGAEPPPVEATPAPSHEPPPVEASQAPSAEPRPVEASQAPPERSPAVAAAAAQTPASSNAQFAYLGQ